MERIIAPDSTILVDFMVARMAGVIEGLEVYPERMAANLDATRGLYCSQEVMLALVRKGMKREDAYRVVQKQALYAWDKGEYFKVLLESDPEVTEYLSEKDLEACFDLDMHFKHVDNIFRRVFKK